MDLLEQCQVWNENDEYQKIIDALEAIPDGERTPEEDSELARAYNNLAEPGDREMLKKAVALLKPHEEYFQGDHCWNFRMGYSYYYLDQQSRALPYFQKALEARPDDEDTKEMIEWCKKRIALPMFSECFRERTEAWWETFAGQEADLRRMMDEDRDHIRGEELVEQMEEVLKLVFDEISFEMGFNGDKYELILTPEGNKVKLFELVYFRKHAPKEVLEHWNILVGRQPNPNFGLRSNGWEVSGDDVQVWLEDQGESRFAVSAYCEKLLSMVQEEENRMWWMLTTLTDQVLGEIPHMRYIDSFDVLKAPKEEPSIPLSKLPEKLKELGLDLSTDPEVYLENSYIGYQMKANEDPEADWRLDIIAGSTNCAALINEYLNNESEYMDDLHADGAAAGFLCYPLDGFREWEGEERSQKIFDFRDRLEEALTGGDGAETLTLTGGATGIYCGYVDFIAWDIRAVLGKAKVFFADNDIPWAIFHTFYREAGTVSLKDAQEDRPDTEDGETIGFAADDIHAITRSPGVSLPKEQMTLKISYAPGGGDSEESDKRFTNWQGQDFDEDTLTPSALAGAMMDYLDCECAYFPSMKDDDPIMSAYSYARRLGVREGFVPVLVKVDETLWECLVMNSDPKSDGADDYAFAPDKVAEYRKKMLAAPMKDGRTVLDELTGVRKEEAEEDDMDWEEILGEMEGGFSNNRFASYWNSDTDMTYPLILAKIPVKNPWEIFAWLPFGGWNECPDTPELMAAAKYWFEQYGAMPAVLTHDELEFSLSAPIAGERAMEAAVQQYGFCPDMDRNFEELGALADTLRQSAVWYFWWD